MWLVRDAEKRIGERRAEVLTLQVQVAEQRGQMRVAQDELRSEIEDRQLHMWKIDSPPLWKAFVGKLVLAVLGTAACVWVLRRTHRLDPPQTGVWFKAAQLLVGLAAAAFAGSALANIVGCVALVTLLAMATLNAVYDAIVLWVTITVLFGAVTVALRTPVPDRC